MLVSQTAIFVVRPVLTYRALELDGDEVAVGLLVVAFALVPAFTAGVLGRYQDRVRPAPVLRLGLAILAIGAGLVAVSSSLWMLYVATVLLGFGALAVMSACQSIVARLTADASMDRDFGALSAAASVGQMIGPLLGGLTIDGPWGRELGIIAAFVGSAVVIVMTMPFAARFRDHRQVPWSAESDESMRWGRVVRMPGVAPGLVASLALLGAVDLLVAFLPLIGERAGIPAAAVGILLSLRAAASVASRLALGMLIARWSRRSLLMASTLFSGALLALVPWMTDIVILGVLLLVAGFFLGIGQPLTMSIVAVAVPETMRATALAMRLAVNKVGQVAVAGVVTVAAGAIGPALGFVALTAILWSSTLMLAVTARRG